jgi:hypothetical protein
VLCSYTEKKCWHAQPCKVKKEQGHCGHGCRYQQVKILHGSLLHAWDRILQTNCQGMYREEEDEYAVTAWPAILAYGATDAHLLPRFPPCSLRLGVCMCSVYEMWNLLQFSLISNFMQPWKDEEEEG